MASVYYLFDDAIHIADNIVQKYSQKDRNLRHHYLAAILIQRAYRGYVVRRNLKVMRQAAITLQKYIRGWLVRFVLPERLQEQHDIACIKWYNKMATKLEACWKGVLVRKEINIRQIMEAKRSAEEGMLGLGCDLLYEEKVKIEHKEEEEIVDSGAWPGQEKFYKQMILEMLFDRHHLIRTKQRQGIFSNISELDEIEKVLASLHWTDYMKNLRKLYNKYYKCDTTPKNRYMFTHKKLRKQEDLFRLRDRHNDQKEIVINPYDIENKKPFNLHAKLDKTPYERYLLLQGKYFVPKKVLVRTEDKSKNICKKDFVISFKKIVKESKVPPYYADFWYRSCDGHFLTN